MRWSVPRRTLRLIFSALVLMACSDTTVPASDGLPDVVLAADGSPTDLDTPIDAGVVDLPAPDGLPLDGSTKAALRILFIGNSYTAVNGLPTVLAKLAESTLSPISVTVTQHTPGGATWAKHDADPAVDALIKQGWDYVVLQDQSQQPWVTYEIKPELISLDAKIQAAGGKTLLFMTWARNETANALTRLSMDMSIVHYYENHAAIVGADVVPVGRAWERALRNPAITLHAADASHPNEHGTYLAACVFYTALTGLSPTELGSGGLNVSAEDQALLQTAAWETHVARKRLASPAIGVWPLAATGNSNDLVAGGGLATGDVAGPDGTPQAATQFGGPKYAAIPYFPGLDPAHITVAFYAHRSDWSIPATEPGETLVAKAWAFQIRQEENQLKALVQTAGTDALLTSSFLTYDVTALTPGWHHLALTYDGATHALWVDGQMVDSGKTSGDLGYENNGKWNAIAIGAAATVGSPFVEPSENSGQPKFTGALSDLRIFDRALTEVELQNL